MPVEKGHVMPVEKGHVTPVEKGHVMDGIASTVSAN